MSCGSGADAFIEKHFKDCVYNVRDYIGFCLGLAAIAFWVVAQLPQYYRNYKTKSAEALSPWFLAQWLLGDTFNLIGALLQGQQLPTTVYTAMYFVIADVFMMMQYIYYGALQRRSERVLRLQARRRHHRRKHHHARNGSAHEREGLTSPDHHQRSAASDQQQQQQQGPQSSAWPSQQQERRRVLHPAGSHASQQPELGSHNCNSAAPTDSQVPWPQGGAHLFNGQPQQPEQSQQGQQQQQEQHHQEAGLHADLPSTVLDDACSDGSDCSSPSRSSSSSKRVKPSDNSYRNSPGKSLPVTAQPVASVSCAAAAAGVGLSGARGVPGIKLLGGEVHWGGIRSVVAVAVLVALGLVSLLPASTTRALLPVSMSGPSGAVVHAPGPNSPARAMHAGLQQQQQQLGGTTQLAAAAGAASGGSKGVGSQGPSSSIGSNRDSNSSKGWARQKKVRDEAPQHTWSFIVGTGLGYTASVLYLCSRISQIHKNYTRKSSEGLALIMFIMAVCANLCTGTSIIMRTFTWDELKEQLPWIIGSLGTISLDMVILWQSTVYTKEGQHLEVGSGAPVHSSRHHHHHHHHHAQHDRQPVQHHTVNVAAASLGQQSAPGTGDVLDNVPLAAHHRSGISGALLGRRHAAAGAGNDLLVDGPEVATPLVGCSRNQ